MFSYKTTLPIFKCWQLIQIYTNHCVGQEKHAWRLNLAHRQLVFNLCSRRRTEFQLGWSKFILWNKTMEILSPQSTPHSTPANHGDRDGSPGFGMGYMGEGILWWAAEVPATWLQAGQRETWLEAEAPGERIKGALGIQSLNWKPKRL